MPSQSASWGDLVSSTQSAKLPLLQHPTAVYAANRATSARHRWPVERVDPVLQRAKDPAEVRGSASREGGVPERAAPARPPRGWRARRRRRAPAPCLLEGAPRAGRAAAGASASRAAVRRGVTPTGAAVLLIGARARDCGPR